MFKFKSAFQPTVTSQESAVRRLLFPVSLWLIGKKKTFSRDLQLWPVTLIYEFDLDRVAMNHHATYVLFKSYTHTTDRLLYTVTKVLGKYWQLTTYKRLILVINHYSVSLVTADKRETGRKWVLWTFCNNNCNLHLIAQNLHGSNPP